MIRILFSLLSSPLNSSQLNPQVIPEAALARYHDALQRWEQERERQKDEFTIMDKDLTESQGV